MRPRDWHGRSHSNRYYCVSLLESSIKESSWLPNQPFGRVICNHLGTWRKLNVCWNALWSFTTWKALFSAACAWTWDTHAISYTKRGLRCVYGAALFQLGRRSRSLSRCVGRTVASAKCAKYWSMFPSPDAQATVTNPFDVAPQE